jgi:hypothetical protein
MWQAKIAEEVAKGSGKAHRITKENDWVPLVFSKETGSRDVISQVKDQEKL